MEDYRLIADALAADIAGGRLRPGDRLPPQREFARDRGIASSTAARVYGELIRRGLAVGEVGRGTFVRTAPARPEPGLVEPGTARIDMELNFSVLPEQPALLAQGLGGLLRPDVFGAALRPVGPAGEPATREAAAALLTRAGWTPDPERILLAGNGRQALAAAIAALVPVGDRLGVEALTYPVVKGIAGRLGVRLVPLAMDESGLVPDALRATHRATPLRAVYLQPTLHNPLGITMPAGRREQIADLLHVLDLFAIEDAVYSFLRPEPAPLAALAADRTIVVDSLSKRLAPGLSLGFAVPPAGAAERLRAALRSGGWTAGRFAVTAATRWMADGTVATIERGKRRDAAARQEIARKHLDGYALRADPQAYHCWWELPEPWRAETFVGAAARLGIAVTPAAAFAVSPAHSPNAVRLGLAAPTIDALTSALESLAALARNATDYPGVE